MPGRCLYSVLNTEDEENCKGLGCVTHRWLAMLRSYELEICLLKELPGFRIEEMTSYHYQAKTTTVPYSIAYSEKQLRSSLSSLESPCTIICSVGVLGRLKPSPGPHLYIDCPVEMEMEGKEQGVT